jgi:hypothetical protein
VIEETAFYNSNKQTDKLKLFFFLCKEVHGFKPAMIKLLIDGSKKCVTAASHVELKNK